MRIRKRAADAVFWCLGAGLAAVLMITGCQKSDRSQDGQKGAVEIPVIFQVDPASSYKSNEELVEAFNREYEGRYRIKVQWMFDTTSAYRSQIKLLNATDELPAVLTDVGFSPAFLQLLEETKRLDDLAPVLAEDETWRGWMDEDVLAPCYEEDGSLYMMPISSNCFSCSGIFYNKELFAQAGIRKFPESWEEFWKCCERLEQAGITPLALHTEGTGWAPMLLATAYIGASKEGEAFLNQRLPESYDGFGVQMGSVLAKAFSYTAADVISHDFDAAYEHFIKEEAAMLPNGYWMMNQLDDSLAEKMGFAPFPGNVMVVSPQMSGWAVVAGYPQEVRQGVVELLRFRARSSRVQADEFLNDKKIPFDSLEADYLDAVKNSPRMISNYQIQWNPILQEEVLPNAIGRLAKGEIHEEEFERILNESVERFERER